MVKKKDKGEGGMLWSKQERKPDGTDLKMGREIDVSESKTEE